MTHRGHADALRKSQPPQAPRRAPLPRRIFCAMATLWLGATTGNAYAAEPGKPAAPAATEAAELKALLDRTDQLWTGTHSATTMAMTVKTQHYMREMRLSCWVEGKDKMLVRVLAPQKDQGTATLKIGDDMYNYLPKIGRTIKISAALRSGSWMGSHFTNDEILQASHLTEDFQAKVVERHKDGNPKNPVTLWTVDLVPKSDAAITWARMRLVVEKETAIRRQAEFFDERGTKVRAVTFSDLGMLGGRRLPTRVRVVPTEPAGEYTELHYEAIDRKAAFDADFFSLTRLSSP